MHYGPETPVGEEVHAEKHRGEGEDFRESMNRVAFALKDDDAHYHEFREIILAQRFLPGGRIQSAMGSPKHVTAYNCFVSGTIPDSFTDADNVEGSSIMDRAKEAAKTMRMGGGIGYDFSTLRPRGSLIKKLRSSSSGPVSFMEHIFNGIGLCTASSGHRRGAQMGILRVDHPDIEEFVRAKQNEGRLTGFNVSVAITDEFMKCVDHGKPFMTCFKGEDDHEIDAQALWEEIMRSTWDYAEPGVIFIDRINEANNLQYCETIAATNPCGEQPLPPFGACLLGSFNLTKYIKGFEAHRSFDWDQFGEDVAPVVRAMDNVVDRSRYPLSEQRAEAITKRRMGLGVTGLANAGEALGYAYGTPGFVEFTKRILARMTREAYLASSALAKEKGAFPLYDDRYLGGEFIRGLDEEVQDAIKRNGIRNSHLTSIAPTGSISLAADNVSGGIEPVYKLRANRTVNFPSGSRVVAVEDYALRKWGVEGRQSSVDGEVSVEEHLAVLIESQRHIDSGCSKTCNVPANANWDDFKSVYWAAWEGRCKGVTTFKNKGKRAGIFVEDAGDNAACEFDPETGTRACAD